MYSALRKAEADGLVEPVRTEQVGRFPTRTVYRLTDAGRTMLEESRSAAWRRIGLPPDPFDLALRSELEILRPRLEPTALAVFEHVLRRHETEVAWHRRLLEQVDGFTTPRPEAPPPAP